MEYIPLKNFSVPQIKTNTHPFQQDIPKNTWIHTDPRICRGSVYAQPVITEDQERARLRLERDHRSRRRVLEARDYNVSIRMVGIVFTLILPCDTYSFFIFSDN